MSSRASPSDTFAVNCGARKPLRRLGFTICDVDGKVITLEMPLG